MPLSAVDPGNADENGEAYAGNINKKSTLYATAPRSKVSQRVYTVDLSSQVLIKRDQTPGARLHRAQTMRSRGCN